MTEDKHLKSWIFCWWAALDARKIPDVNALLDGQPLNHLDMSFVEKVHYRAWRDGTTFHSCLRP